MVNVGSVSLDQVLRALAGVAEIIAGLPVTLIKTSHLDNPCLSDKPVESRQRMSCVSLWISSSNSEENWAKDAKAWELGKKGRVLLDLISRPNKLQQPATFMLRFAVRNTRSSLRNDCALVAAVANPLHLSRHEIDSLFHEVGGEEEKK